MTTLWAKPAARLQSPREEIANSLSAGVGLAAALATAPWLAVTTPAASNPWTLAGVYFPQKNGSPALCVVGGARDQKKPEAGRERW
jgi:hypothetical protein